MEAGEDLVDLHALMAPRPVLVSGGVQDPPKNWQALNHLVGPGAELARQRLSARVAGAAQDQGLGPPLTGTPLGGRGAGHPQGIEVSEAPRSLASLRIAAGRRAHQGGHITWFTLVQPLGHQFRAPMAFSIRSAAH